VGAYTWFEEDGAVLAMSVRVFEEEEPDAKPHEKVARGPVGDVEELVDALLEGYERRES
jgi:hypothetical protein